HEKIILMGAVIYKQLLTGLLLVSQFYIFPLQPVMVRDHKKVHPFFVSVTEFNHNQKDNNLEISCKLFADDFENTLKKQYKTNIDLTHPQDVKQVEKIILEYVQKHLRVKLNSRQVILHLIGFEKENEAIWCYLQVNNVPAVRKLEITNNLLYEKYDTQISIMHASVGGNRKSTRLVYPDSLAEFEW
ncbi:MAG: DUF6702 family protein, partial [Chitinophagaceae bacterium]